jgi:PAS domain S-box-containing protein
MGVVLIAFERESEQSAVEQLLTARGHQVLKSANGLAALDAARREPPDLVISDIVLPRMDGFALCRKWKQDERLQAVPFVFYTRRHDDPKYERFALELGAERFLSRSVQPEALANAVDELLGVPSQAASVAPATNDGAAGRAAALEKDRQALARDKQAVEKDRQAIEKERQALERARQTLEHDKQALEKAKASQSQELERVRLAHDSLQQKLGELEATNQRLAAGEARFRRVFEANPLPMWIADRATSGFIAVNDAALALYGYERSEFLALKNNALFAQDQHAPEGVSLHRRKDGTTLSVATASRDIEFDGRAADLVAAYDLSLRMAAERRSLEQTQRELEARLQKAEQEIEEQTRKAQEAQAQLAQSAGQDRLRFDALADGCLVLDPEGKIVDVNPAYLRMSGYQRDELLAMNVSELEDTGSGDDTLRLQMGRLRGGERYETKHRRKDGSSVDIEISIGQLDGPSAERIVVVRDVTQRRREQMAQRAAQRQHEHLLDLFKQSESLDESSIVRRAIEEAQDATGDPLAFLFFFDNKDKTVTLAAMRQGRGGQVVMTGSDPQPAARAGALLECVRGKHAVINNDVSRTQSLPGLPELNRHMGVPLVAGDEVLGVLGVANRDGVYGDGDQRSLAFVADCIARVLHACVHHALAPAHRRRFAQHGRFLRAHDRAPRSLHRRLVTTGRSAGGCHRARSRARRRASACFESRRVAARHRQHRRAGIHSRQAGAAHRNGNRADAHARRGGLSAARRHRPRRARRRHHLSEPRAFRRQRLSARREGRGHSARGPYPPYRRHRRSHVLTAPVSAGGGHGRGAR